MPLPPHLKSLGVSIQFQSDHDTLKDAEINEVFQRAMQAIVDTYKAEIRG